MGIIDRSADEFQHISVCMYLYFPTLMFHDLTPRPIYATLPRHAAPDIGGGGVLSMYKEDSTS